MIQKEKNMKSTIEDMRLSSILNMEHLLDGGLKTEYGLAVLAEIVKSGINGYPAEAAHILAQFTNVNLKKLNEEHNTGLRNEKQILYVMFELANAIVKADPEQKEGVRVTMKIIRDNNPELPKTKPENAFLMNLGVQNLWERSLGGRQ